MIARLMSWLVRRHHFKYVVLIILFSERFDGADAVFIVSNIFYPQRLR